MIGHPTRTLLYCLIATMAACVPILPHVDYMPEMAGGKILIDRCWGAPSVEYRTGNITLTSWIASWPDNKLKLHMQLDVVEGNTVELLSPEVAVSSPLTAGATIVRIPGISLNGNPVLPMEPIGPMVGRDLVAYGFRSVRHFWLFVPLDAIGPTDMRIVLPMLNVNDRIVTLPAITFSRQLRVQLIAPLQC
ncbi:MAG: hypothetical protein ABI790_18680 [Betaproteobacteria bacterium]